jgi:GGDEF domain-containing protein
MPRMEFGRQFLYARDACTLRILLKEEFSLDAIRRTNECQRSVVQIRQSPLGYLVVVLGHGVPAAGAREVRYTVSVGITQVSLEDSVDAAFGRADAALYRSKKLGRNRVSVDGSDEA